MSYCCMPEYLDHSIHHLHLKTYIKWLVHLHEAARTGNGAHASHDSCIKVEIIATNNIVHLIIIF